MDFSKVTAIEIPEGKVTKVEDSEGRVLWKPLPDPNEYAYGIRWDHTVPDSQATTACERIGNLELHKTLPIQSKFATCIHQGTDIKYWCDPNDSRFRKDTTGFRIVNERIFLEKTTDAEKNAVLSDYSPSATYDYTIQFPDGTLNKYEEAKLLVTTYKYLYAWIKINDINIARVNKVDTVNKKAYITTATGGLITGEAIVPTLEFGCSINGYDGEISVYTPKFYIWSVDKGGAGNEVWISEKRCVGYARRVKPHLISIGRCTISQYDSKDNRWGWLTRMPSGLQGQAHYSKKPLSVVNYQPNFRGGSTYNGLDHYLGNDNFRTMLGKGLSFEYLYYMRKYTQQAGGQLLYYQIWNAIVWCYFIEYADFNVKKAFNSNLTDEGYHQGGLGEGVTSVDNWDAYNIMTSVVPIDYTLSIGNNTGIVTNPSHSFDKESENNTTWYDWNINRVTATTDRTDKILNITAIPKIYSDWMLKTTADEVGGTHKYKIEGLTGNQTVVFKRQQGNLTITTDGEYDVNWGTNYNDRYITFGLVQENCNIKITILKAPAFTYTLTQRQLNVPCYRGFNTFWYGDTAVLIEGFMSKYDSASGKMKFYFTDSPTKFGDNEGILENVIDMDVVEKNWAKNIMVGQTANLITNRTSNNANYMNFYRSDFLADNESYFIAVGGSALEGSHCGLGRLNPGVASYKQYSNVGFVKCHIID